MPDTGECATVIATVSTTDPCKDFLWNVYDSAGGLIWSQFSGRTLEIEPCHAGLYTYEAIPKDGGCMDEEPQ